MSYPPPGTPGSLPPKPGAWLRRFIPWAAAILLSVYLGLAGGGYDIVVRSELGLIVWWVILLGVLVGLLPRQRSPRAGWIAAALLAGFLVWTWLGLSWTGSHELTLDEVARVSTYLGVFVLAVAAAGLSTARPLLNGLGCGIALVSGLAVLSKLAPGLFPADTARSFYVTARLSYPFDYADGVGEYAALGIPLLLFIATSGRTLIGRAAAAGALQILLLCLAMTVSRGGVLAAAVGIAAFYALIPNRTPRLPTLAISGAGIAVLMVALLHRSALRDSVAAAPAGQRHSMLVIVCLVLLVIAATQAASDVLTSRISRPAWMVVSRRRASAIAAAIALALVVVIVVAVASGAVGRAWSSFKLWSPAVHSNQYFRLLSLAGSHRYQYWQVAWHAFTSSVLHGIGPGTFRFYWDQHTAFSEYVLNAHSLWFETLAETGLVGWALLAGFFGYVVIGGVARSLRLSVGTERRTVVATATAGVVAFCAAASFDWVWQIGVVPMVALVLAAITVVPEDVAITPVPEEVAETAAEQPAASGPRAYSGPSARVRRGALAGAALLAMALITIPLASTVALRRSQSDAAHGRLIAALAAADTARAIEPGAASPYLQRALLLEQENQLAAAAVSISAAIAREPANYALWLTASRIATERDRPREATADYAEAARLYPTSPLFSG